MKMNVAVIYGGRSGEHEISLRSAESVMNALAPDRYTVSKFLIGKEGRWSPYPILPEPGRHPEIQVVIPVLHGTFGEDGTVQGLLELADLPYVGAGVLASAVCMDKETTKRLLERSGISVVEYVTVTDKHYRIEHIESAFPYPMFVKPANLGSSVGITKAKNREELRGAIENAALYDRKVIVERSVIGQEFECSVLGNGDPKAATPCEILPSREFYDYDDKYILDKTEFRLPANVPEQELQRIRQIAIDAYRATHCEGMARVDFLRDAESGRLYVNEINTIPGFTSISMYPKMWEFSGVPYPELLDKLIALALERHAAKKGLKYTR